MSYMRVIPRDLFNEGSLLKCYGQLYLNLERMGMEGCLMHTADDGPFRVKQWQDDGSISLQNVILVVRGHQVHLRRPLNARSQYPLWATVVGDHEMQVFNSDGSFADEFVAFLKGHVCI